MTSSKEVAAQIMAVENKHIEKLLDLIVRNADGLATPLENGIKVVPIEVLETIIEIVKEGLGKSLGQYIFTDS